MADVVLTVRIPDELARLTRQVCDARDETVSQVVRRALRAYVDSAPPQGDLLAVARSVAKRAAVPSVAAAKPTKGRAKGGRGSPS